MKQIEEFLPRGLLRPELFVGVLTSIDARTALVNLSVAGQPTGSYFSQGRYGCGEVGEFVLVEGQQNIILGRITEVRLPENDRRLITPSFSGKSNLDAVARVQLLGCVAMDTLWITAGIDTYPRIADRVYAAPHRFLSILPRLADPEKEIDETILLNIGAVDVAHESNVSLKPERLFGRHCAILGSTGGGKSWTTARLIEECLKFKAKMVLLDATGEYRDFKHSDIVHCHIGDPVVKAEGSVGCSLPPSNFIESDFVALFEPAGKIQGPKMRAAIRSLRLAKLKPSLAPGGFIKKIDQVKGPVHQAEAETGISEKLDDPSSPFDAKYLASQIEQECVYPDGFGSMRGQKDLTKWGGEDGNFSHCLSLVARINGVLSSIAFKCVFSSPAVGPSITEKMKEFFESEKKLLRICLSGVSHEFNAREIFANAIGRNLLVKARHGEFLERPVLVIVDEAHNFLGRHIGGDDWFAKLDSFELIAREGRKYAVNICLSTQRPRDITEGVLSQMGTLVVHRLTNDRDREVVEKACGEIDKAASAFLPNLLPGEAAIIGTDFPIPLTIQIKKPETKPRSEGPNYQKFWHP